VDAWKLFVISDLMPLWYDVIFSMGRIRHLQVWVFNLFSQVSLPFYSGYVRWFLWGTNWISFSFCSGDVMWFLWGTNWISLPFFSGYVRWFLWGTNWISFSFWSGNVMWFLWGKNWISLSFCSGDVIGLESRKGSVTLITWHPLSAEVGTNLQAAVARSVYFACGLRPQSK
jgi:hypothetical protein